MLTPIVNPISTQRLTLIPSTLEMVQLEMHDLPGLAGALGAVVPLGWPHESVADALPFFANNLAARPELVGWQGWYWLSRAESNPPTLVGSGGFKDAPSPDGLVEIGYGMLPAYRRRGYALEAVTALIAWAFSHPHVSTILAETESTNKASTRILERCSFTVAGEGVEPGHRRYRLPRNGICQSKNDPPHNVR